MGGSSEHKSPVAITPETKVDLTKKDAKPEVDPEKPKTTMRIRLLTGQTLDLEVNLCHLVSDVLAYVDSISPGGSGLLTGRPPKPLDNPGLTIEEAKLMRAMVIQNKTQ